jgi:hypothetical protein
MRVLSLLRPFTPYCPLYEDDTLTSIRRATGKAEDNSLHDVH